MAAPASAETVMLPSWASNTANAVTARQASAAPFNIEGRYVVKPAFLKVLREVEGVNQAQVVFPYREVIKANSYLRNLSVFERNFD